MATPEDDASASAGTNVDVQHVHLVLSLIELDIVVDALRSVGNVELTERIEATLRQMIALVGQSPADQGEDR